MPAPLADTLSDIAHTYWVPDQWWAVIKHVIPAVPVRAQGRGRRRVDDRAVFTAIVYVLITGCAWRHLPTWLGVTVPTAHRRFREWSEAGVWQRLHDVAPHGQRLPGITAWAAQIRDNAAARTHPVSRRG